jgi:hypothetical protein
MSRDPMTIEGVWIRNRIYYITRDYTLQITVTQRLVFSVTVFTAFLGNVSQQWTFFCPRLHFLAGWQPSHTNLLLLLLPSQHSPVIADGTHRKRLFHDCVRVCCSDHVTATEPLSSNGRFTEPFPSNDCLWFHNSGFQQILLDVCVCLKHPRILGTVWFHPIMNLMRLKLKYPWLMLSFFVGYLTTLSVPHYIASDDRMTDEWKRIWKEAVLAKSR